VLKNLVHLPEKPFSTASTKLRRAIMSAVTAAFPETGKMHPWRPHLALARQRLQDHLSQIIGNVVPIVERGRRPAIGSGRAGRPNHADAWPLAGKAAVVADISERLLMTRSRGVSVEEGLYQLHLMPTSPMTISRRMPLLGSVAPWA
jgi:hypothetical protein